MMQELMEKMEALQSENQALWMTLEKKAGEFASLETSVAEVRKINGLPYVVTCAYREEWDTSSATITYDSLISDFKNRDDPDGGDGVLDIATGVYTVIRPAGYY